MLFLEHRVTGLIPWNLFRGALIPAMGIPIVETDTEPRRVCLVLPLHCWLEAKCFQDSVLNNPHQEGFEGGSVEQLSWKPLTRGLVGCQQHWVVLVRPELFWKGQVKMKI